MFRFAPPMRLQLLATALAATRALRPMPVTGAPAAVAEGCSSPLRRILLPAALAAAALPPQTARAAEAAASDCLSDCVRECNLVAPGNLGYCQTQCESYCEDAGANYGKSDVVRTDVTASAGSDCSRYKTDAAQQYCAKQNKLASTPKPSPMSMNNGIFGDSGVTYSSNVEDLLASAFGATRQNKSLKEANVDEFAGEVFDKAKTALLGQ